MPTFAFSRVRVRVRRAGGKARRMTLDKGEWRGRGQGGGQDWWWPARAESLHASTESSPCGLHLWHSDAYTHIHTDDY